MAEWLNTAFYSFDYAIFEFWHNAAKAAGGFLTPLMNFVSFFGAHGLCMIVLGVILLLFKKTRKHGVAALMAILFGFIMTNLLIKKLVARPRPYTHEEYISWWEFVGGVKESEHSFPSGHTTVATDTLIAIFLISKKKNISWLCIVGAVLMGVSRTYLVVHYATDVIGGLIIGTVAAVLSTVLVNYLFGIMERHSDNALCKFVFNACIIDLFRKKKPKENTEE